MKFIDSFLNSITMYRLVLYSLAGLAVVAVALGFTGGISLGGPELLVSLGVLLAVCLASNYALAKWYGAPTNVESPIITALILFFIMSPSVVLVDIGWLALVGYIAMASKYVVAWNEKHIFNPAAFGAVAAGLMPVGATIWWVGSAALLPVVLVAGLLIVKKIRRFTLFFACVAASVVTVALLGYSSGLGIADMLRQHFLSWPIIFLATIMLTEPLTTPPTRRLQLMYGIIVGVVSSWPFSLGILYGSPELALLIGNLFAYAFSLKRRLRLVLKEKIAIARDTYEFIFTTPHAVSFRPGQYLEWMLPHSHADSRGVRRFFTIASSPTEDTVRLGVRFSPNSSSFKQALNLIAPGDTVYAGQLSGDFTLPKDVTQKLVFIAGGIGITPFRSMLRYLIDREECRDVVLFYSNKSPADIAYKDLIEESREKIGTKTVYLVTDELQPGDSWTGERGFITEELLKAHVPDWQGRIFYLSGPNAMVESYKKLLRTMGVPHTRIVTDYFPGYA